ncbi:MAG: DUF2680 domain-containing protein [Alistipes indistinctus]
MAEKRDKLIADGVKASKELMDGLFKSSLNRLEKESEANEEWAEEQRERVDELEEAGAISKEQADARKAAIDSKEEERAKELEKRKPSSKRNRLFTKNPFNRTDRMEHGGCNFGHLEGLSEI